MSALPDGTYYIGQGSVLLAPRVANGGLSGPFNPVGDCSALKITNKQKTVEVEENTSGFGATALYASVSVPLSFELTLPVWSIKNMVNALYGTASGANAGGTVSAEAVSAYPGGYTYLQNFGLTAAPTLSTATGSVSGVTVGTPGSGYVQGSTTVTFSAPTSGVTATGHAVVTGGAITAIVIDNPGSGYSAAPTITISGAGTSGAATASITVVTLVEGTDVTSNLQFGNFEALPTSAFWAKFSGAYPVPLTAAYSYGANNGGINILTAPSPEFSLRFNGLNVAQPNGQTFGSFPVWIKRCKVDFAKTISLIDRKEGSFDLSGMILMDSTATDNSPFGWFYKA